MYVNDASATSLVFGGTTLQLAPTCADGAILSRSGTQIVGRAGSAQGSVLAWHAASTAFLDSSRAWAFGVIPTTAVNLENTTPAAAGAQQFSPATRWCGRGWKTNAVAASQTVAYRAYVEPVQGAASPSGQFIIASSVDGGAETNILRLTVPGVMYIASTLSAASLISGSSISARNATYIDGVDLSTGLGLCSSFYSAYNNPLVLQHSNRADGANNIVFSSCWDRNAAAITNAATMRLHSFGWTNNADVYTELAAVYCDGTVKGVGLAASGDPGGRATMTTLTNVTPAAGANAPTTINVPGAGAAAQQGWLKIYIGATAYVVPYWAAA